MLRHTLLAVIRIILIAVALITISIIALCYCLFRPFHRDNTYMTSKLLRKVPALFGVQVEVRMPESVKSLGPVVWTANHQNNYDLFTHANAVMPGTVSVGKKSLKWIPLFGYVYWLTGNILIDRNNTNKAKSTIEFTADKIKRNKLSVWMFPEGTRSRGRGFLPLKTGAFRTAMQAGVPVVPICASNQQGTIFLNRWNNGKIIIEFLEQISFENVSRENLRSKVDEVHSLMNKKIQQLSIEAKNYQNP